MQNASIERICELNTQLCSPIEYEDYHYICGSNGEIYKVQNGQVKLEFNFGGSPTSLVIDQKGTKEM